MAEPVGALRVELSANAAQFEKDMGRARKSVNSTANRMRRNMRQIRRSVKRCGQKFHIVSWGGCCRSGCDGSVPVFQTGD